MRSRPFVVALIWLMFCNISLAASNNLEPKISPGYSPEEDITEHGLWMELEDYERAIKRSAMLIKDKNLNEYVKNVACKVSGDYCRDLRVYIIRNPNFNASMTANGVMQVWTGLLVRVSSEDELAAVIGHELAHYTQLHTLDRLNRLSKSMTTGSIFDLSMIVLTGVYVPLGQMAGVANLMAFSVQQEEEADILGVRFMADGGYDPGAAANVWEMILNEEDYAVVKSPEPGLFSKTHPGSESRITNLRTYVAKEYKNFASNSDGNTRHVEMLENYYMLLMEDQLDTNRFGRTEAILRRHLEIGINTGMVHFFQGEMYRQRNQNGDMQLAKEEYLQATRGTKPIAEAHLNLGYLYLKEKDLARAKDHFVHYLEINPNADDRAMIEFYIQETTQ